METPNSSASSTARDDWFTVAAIAALAYISAAMAHEVLGHGVAFHIAGGREGVFTTTRLITRQDIGRFGSRLFDLGGPAGDLFIAALAYALQRILRKAAPHLRLFLILSLGFNLFWATGYLVFSGVLGRGDWMALVYRPYLEWPLRIVFIVVGALAYRASIRLVARELHWLTDPSPENSARIRSLILVSYLVGGIVGTLGPIYDPRGALEMLNSGALSSFGAAFGFLSAVPLFRRSSGGDAHSGPIDRSLAWLCAAGAAILYFVGILGPGIRFSWW